MSGFWKRDDRLRRLERELRAARHEAPTGFIRALVAREREPRWLRPRLRIGVAVAIVGLAMAAMASAGGMGVIKHATKTAAHAVKRTTHKSKPRVLFDNPSNKQYKKHCGGAGEDKCHITIFDSNVKEGNTGTTPMSFTISLDATPDAPVTVHWATRDGTAHGPVCPADYITASGNANFPAGTGSTTITVLVCGDRVSEPDETFFVDLSAPSPNADIVRTPATGTIVNDDR